MIVEEINPTDVETLRSSGQFDSRWYLEHYPDVKMLGMDAAQHYLWIGKRLGRRPSPLSAIPVIKTGDALLPLLPRNDRNYWIPQAMRNYLIETQREGAVPLVTSLMDLVVAYGRGGAAFEESQEYRPLLAWLRDMAMVRAPAGVPDVSIIIPVHGKLVLTLTSIASVLSSTSRFSAEIIVADDCSTDGTASAIPAIGGCVRHVRNLSNCGFLLNCNKAAEKARGKYLVLLNNDTIALPNWLDHLIAPLKIRSDIGLTGSKLLNNDGTLQEAGGIYWSDGSAWNFGRNQDPRLPEFNYAKESDYCSGASIAMPLELWRRLGGFDEYFLPAYCEDSDLAFRVRQMGLKVVYQPRSEIIHHEGMSHGRDLTQGIKAHQVANSAKLTARWGEALRRDHFPNGEQLLLARDRSRDKPHILIVDHYVPQWDKDAGSRSTYDAIKVFVESGFHVTLWPDNLFYDAPYASQLQDMGVEVIYGAAMQGGFEKWWSANGRYFPYAFLNRAHIALGYVDAIRTNAACKVLYYGHDLSWKRLMQEYETTKDRKIWDTAQGAKRSEDEISSKSDYIIYPAAEECAYARKAFPAAKGVLQMPVWIIDPEDILRGRAHIDRIIEKRTAQAIFVGGFNHSPNGDGVRWFLNEVLPLVRAREPRFRIVIVGSHMPSDIASRDEAEVVAKGWVSDAELEQLTAEADCTVVPLRFGAGVKGKVISAFAAGSPVVSTSIGMQGIADSHEVGFVGDTAAEFAEALLACLSDRAEATRRATRALGFVREHYSREAMIRTFRDAVPELAMTARDKSPSRLQGS